jgi:hypothetical protein
MAFAFSMIAATFKFLVSALAGDLMAIGIELAGFRLNVCLISKQKKSYNLSEFFSLFFNGERTFCCQPYFLSDPGASSSH